MMTVNLHSCKGLYSAEAIPLSTSWALSISGYGDQEVTLFFNTEHGDEVQAIADAINAIGRVKVEEAA